MKIWKVNVEYLDMEGKYTVNKEDFYFTEETKAWECCRAMKKEVIGTGYIIQLKLY